nr:GDSL-type esterase/lipase family protein [Bacteriovorax sp. HI3]
MKIFKKIFIFSFVTLFFLELSLHTTAFVLQKVMLKSQESRVVGAKYKILCIGESTTAWGGDLSYPSLLEKTLNLRFGDNKFKVINAGKTGTTTKVLVDYTPRLINEYRPNVGIIMTGINDLWSLPDNDPEPWEAGLEWLSEYSRIAKFVRIALINKRFSQREGSLHNIASGCKDLTHYSEAQTKFNDYVYRAGEMVEAGKVKEAIHFLKMKAIYLNNSGFCMDSYPLLEKIIEIQRDVLKDPKLALETVEIFLRSDVAPFYRQIFVNIKNNLREELKLQPDGITYATQINYWENSSYKINIQSIVRSFQEKGIPVVVMQYPRLPIAPLKRVLISHEGVTFVENSENFEKRLEKKKFSDLFSDGFGKVFGHFTPLGAQMVANTAALGVLEALDIKP